MQLDYESERLHLRILREDAADQVLRFYLENQAVFEEIEPTYPDNFYTNAYQSTSLRCEFNLMLNFSQVRFYIFEKERPETIIGTVSFYHIKRFVYQSFQIGYKFHQAFWHKGYAREAVSKALSVLFETEKLHRAEALVLPSTEASIRLLEALGFEKEGVCRSCIRLRGGWTDHLLYSLIR